MLGNRRNATPRIGIFGLGLAAYWPQFPGMEQRMKGYVATVVNRLKQFPAEVVESRYVDTPQAAAETADLLARADLDVVVCYIPTYGTSSLVVPIAQRVRKPLLILNLQPTAAVDYVATDTQEFLSNCTVCVVPELACTLDRCDIDFRVVTGVLEGEHPAAKRAWNEIEEWIKAAQVVRTLRNARVGFLGHTYPGMMDLYTDFTMLHGQLGLHVEILEMCDLQERVTSVSNEQVHRKVDEIKKFFVVSEDSPSDPLAKAPRPEALEWSARVACALDSLLEDFCLDALGYYYRGANDNEYERLGASLVLGSTLLTCKGYSCAGEGDLRNAIAMLTMDAMGVGGSFTEFYLMDFEEELLLMGHDGPAHIAISSGKPILRGLGLYHGKAGHGISVEMSVKSGPITILSLVQTRDGKLRFLVAEGEVVPGEILRIGNTNSRVKFPLTVQEFVDHWCTQGPAHHWAMGTGHTKNQIRKIANLLGIQLIDVC